MLHIKKQLPIFFAMVTNTAAESGFAVHRSVRTKQHVRAHPTSLQNLTGAHLASPIGMNLELTLDNNFQHWFRNVFAEVTLWFCTPAEYDHLVDNILIPKFKDNVMPKFTHSFHAVEVAGDDLRSVVTKVVSEKVKTVQGIPWDSPAEISKLQDVIEDHIRTSEVNLTSTYFVQRVTSWVHDDFLERVAPGAMQDIFADSSPFFRNTAPIFSGPVAKDILSFIFEQPLWKLKRSFDWVVQLGWRLLLQFADLSKAFIERPAMELVEWLRIVLRKGGDRDNDFDDVGREEGAA